jgi:hypothetical protein
MVNVRPRSAFCSIPQLWKRDGPTKATQFDPFHSFSELSKGLSLSVCMTIRFVEAWFYRE